MLLARDFFIIFASIIEAIDEAAYQAIRNADLQEKRLKEQNKSLFRSVSKKRDTRGSKGC